MLKSNLLIGFGTSNPVYDPDALAYFVAIGLSDRSKMDALNTFVLALKAALGITLLRDAFDYMYWRAAPSLAAALIDMTGNGFSGTAVNTPGHTSGQGVNSNGSSSYINNNFTPSTNGVRWAANSASIFCYVRTSTAGAGVSSGVAFGVNVTGNTFLYPHFSSNVPIFNINANAGGAAGSGSTQTGFFAIDVTGTTETLYRDGTSIGTGTVSGTLPTGKVYSLCWNNGGSASDFMRSDGIIAFEMAGKHFTSGEHVSINNAVAALKASAAGW